MLLITRMLLLEPAGNEPSMLLPWSHAWAGPAHAWRAQFWPRWHLRTYYSPDQNLIPGNDDYGSEFRFLILRPVRRAPRRAPFGLLPVQH
jgi:putative alpha-1,2-mannosidase